jgi:hypothetical protein
LHAGTIDINKVDFPYFSEVNFINNKKEGIAKSNIYTKELVLNLFYWQKLKPEHKFYVLAHEEGHIFFKTKDELKADEHASERYMAAGLPITESIHALSDHLDRNSPVHIARAWMQYQRALQYDWQHNKNKKAWRTHYDTKDEVKQKLLKNEFRQ